MDKIEKEKDAAAPGVAAPPAYEVVGIAPGEVYVIGLHKTVDLGKLTAAELAELQAIKYPHVSVPKAS